MKSEASEFFKAHSAIVLASQIEIPLRGSNNFDTLLYTHLSERKRVAEEYLRCGDDETKGYLKGLFFEYNDRIKKLLGIPDVNHP